MKKIFSKILFFVSSTTVFSTYAQPFSVVMAPQPTPCVTGKFSSTGTNWKSIVLTVTNQCGKEVDFQNATITFQNGISLNTNFWGLLLLFHTLSHH